MSLSPEFRQKLDELYQSFIEFDATQSDRLTRYRNIEPESAEFIAMLIRVQGSQSILEIGTSTGYSTLWLADAAKATQAQITTLEIDAQRSNAAKKYAQDLSVDDVIDFWVGDAQDFLKSSHEHYDFILLDAERDAYIDYWQYLEKILNPKRGVLIVDNVISHADQVVDFLQLIQNDDRFITSTIPLGAGLFMVSYKD